MTVLTTETVGELLKDDIKVKVAGVDADGVLRGKIMAKEKFVSTVKSGFGFSSAIFGWDMHDELYATEDNTEEEGYSDLTAVADLASFRRLPWEDNIPFFMLTFRVDEKPAAGCPRGLIEGVKQKLGQDGYHPLAGVELEFVNFQTPSEDGYGNPGARPDLAAFISKSGPQAVRPITQGMFGYSMTRPVASKRYFHDIFDTSAKVRCNLEVWHTESGPGVFEAALGVQDAAEMADRVSLFKLLTRSLGVDHNITPCFMAKPLQGLPGSSGHIHVSLVDSNGKNLFARDSPNPNPQWKDLEHFSDLGCHFLAGIIDALPDIMPLFAPTVNSYKRYVENFWAPVFVTWGFEDRIASLRLIGPPSCKASATRIEVRIPGADLHPHYALSVIFSAGLRGIQKKLDIKVPPQSARKKTDGKPLRLADTLQQALDRFSAPGSVARELLGDEFVDFFTISRRHELKLWREAVTDWEFTRYIELV
ncbi:unnamed protein product [Clonostachys chloroleuca]|uniref:Glutamine synthetase n=1 Tax=Clonostachys chloroleuca TaxID=1926264 RepID=A0AA35VGV0_9HYPO|nr:unnamed protein product [Clonostachys chloroleuca]